MAQTVAMEISNDMELADTSYTDELLYHGTSNIRWESIHTAGYLRLALTGDPKIGLTPKLDVAEYWALLSAETDADTTLTCYGMILTFGMSSLMRGGYFLSHYSDPVYGKGACDWEEEIACWVPIPTQYVLSAFPMLMD